ncbi:hypothetical protein [Gemmata palustris]|uniref:hypothetical protein n=1 Tax=Gemmata palustris TaxID=2822762 RepID=UPI0036F2736F
MCEEGGRFAGTYYVRPNHPGRGSHVANAGYMVSSDFRGRGPRSRCASTRSKPRSASALPRCSSTSW